MSVIDLSWIFFFLHGYAFLARTHTHAHAHTPTGTGQYFYTSPAIIYPVKL